MVIHKVVAQELMVVQVAAAVVVAAMLEALVILLLLVHLKAVMVVLLNHKLPLDMIEVEEAAEQHLLAVMQLMILEPQAMVAMVLLHQ